MIDYLYIILDFIFDRVVYVLLILFIIFFTTFFQKYHYIILYKIWHFSWKVFTLVSNFFIRLWVIIHEFAHIFFAFISWAEIKEVKLFSKDWWHVRLSNKDYIWAIWSNNMNPILFWLFLFFNRVWVFLTSLGPLLFWILISLLLVNFSFWFSLLSINTDISYYDFNQLWFLNVFILFLYWFFLWQSFILSWQDIKNLFFYNWTWVIEIFVGSLINTFFFILFLFIASYLYIYFVFFWTVYFIWFLTLLIIYYLLLLIKKLI